MTTEIIEQEDIVLEDNQLICVLSGEVKKIKAKKETFSL